MKQFILFILIALSFVACGEMEQGKSEPSNNSNATSDSSQSSSDESDAVVESANVETMKEIEWKKSFKRTFREYTVIDSEDNFYSLHREDLPHRAIITKVDKNGVVLWKKTVEFNAQLDWTYSYPGELKIDKNNNLYLVGSGNEPVKNLENFSQNDLIIKSFVIKYSSEGNQLWEYIENSNIKTYGEALSIDKNGNVYFVGRDEQKKLSLIKLDSNGKKVMQKFYDSFAYSNVGKVDIIHSKKTENIYLLTQIKKSKKYNLSILKLKLNGTQLWNKSYKISDNSYSTELVGFEEDSNRNVIAVINRKLDTKSNQPMYDIKVFKINSNGSKLWENDYGTVQSDRARFMTLDKQDNIFVTGYTKGAFDGFENSEQKLDTFLSKLSPEGDILKTDQINTFGPNGYNVAGGQFIGFDSENHLFLTANGIIGSDYTYSSFLVKYK